jgi:hypothetical protein
MTNPEVTRGRDLESAGMPRRSLISGPGAKEIRTWSDGAVAQRAQKH